MSRLIFTYSEERCVRLAGKLMQSTGMLYPHAKVGVAVSGGVDSGVMLQVLHIRQRIVPFPFSIMALHVNPGFDPDNHAPMERWLQDRDIPYHFENTDHGPKAHSAENRSKSPCFYCAMLRRTRLFQLCKEYGLTHLAFGHNADDLVSSFLMNLFQGGRVEGMGMKESFFKGDLTVIRPLMLVDKKLITKAAASWDLPVWQNPCPSAGATKRSEVMEQMEDLCRGHKGRRKNVFNALCRWQHNLTMRQQVPEDRER